MRCKFLYLFIVLLSGVELSAQPYKSEISLQSDNDAYLLRGSDKYYTDGLVINYRHVLKPATNSIVKNKLIGFEIGQKIFTPHTGNIANAIGYDDPLDIDRPFAAYLYAGANLTLLYNNENTLKLSAQIGIIGAQAFGKQVQTFVHHTFKFYSPGGWEYQIDNNAVLNLSAEYSRLLARSSWIDYSFTSHANIGNGFTGAGVGNLVRIGKFNNFFNSISTQSNALQTGSIPRLGTYELFFFYKPQIDFIAYDATVEGGLFTPKNKGSIAVTGSVEPLVLTNQIGICYSKKRIGIYIAAIFNTKNVTAMHRADKWGTFTLSYAIQ